MSFTFDQSYYLTQYPEVAVAISLGYFASAYDHYVKFGAKELRNPNALFNALEYSQANPEVLTAVDAGYFSSVWDHYVQYGLAEGRAPSKALANFDSAAYLDANPDVKTAVEGGSFHNALEHYLNFGAAEGRPLGVGVETFELTNGTDVATANVFNAGLVYSPGGNDRINSLQDEDVLTGKGENPTLNATLGNANDNGGLTITPTLKGIETINVAFSGSGGAVNQLDLQDVTGDLKAINITRVNDGIGAAATIDNIGNVPADLSLANSGQAQQNVAFLFTNDGAAGAADETKLTLSKVNVALLTVEETVNDGNLNQGVETINLVSTGSANTVTALQAEDLKTLNITGDKALTLNGLNNVAGSLTKIDASALEASLTLGVTSGILNAVPDGATQGNVAFNLIATKNDDTVTVTHGAGVGVNAISANDTVDLGEGTDILRLQSGGQANVDFIAVATTPQVKGAETIQVFKTGAAANAVLALRADQAEGDQAILLTDRTNFVANTTTYNVVNLSNAEADQVSIAHSGSPTLVNPAAASNSLANNIVNLDVAAGVTKASITIKDGVNSDPRFNFQLYTDSDLTLNAANGTIAAGQNNVNGANAVVSLNLFDSDTESNSVSLISQGYLTGGAVRADLGTSYTDTITLKGGVSGQYLNLDASTAGRAGGGYRLDVSGNDAGDFAAGLGAAADAAVAATGVTASASYRYLDAGQAAGVADVRLIAQNLVAGEYAGDVIARFGDVTRADGISSQSVTTGAGNDTLIFDAQGVANSGYTSGDTVKAGTGLDTLVIDGNTAAVKADGTAGVGGRINIQKSEWDNTSGVDVLRLAGNQGVGNVGNGAIIGGAAGGYYIEIDNEFVRQTDAGNGLVIVSNDGDLGQSLESDLVLNLRALSQTSNVTFVGANGNGAANNASNRLLVEDNSANSQMKLDGGDTNTAALDNTGNNNVLEVFNTAQVSINDLSQTKNFGRIEFTNDVSTAQTLTLALNDAVLDALVDSNHAAANTAGNTERLVIVANNSTTVAGAVANLNIDASAATNKFGIDVLVGRNTTNTIAGSAGADKVVILGNYTAAEAVADGHAAVNLFQGANAITGAALANNGTAYKGADLVAGTLDDVLLAYNGTFTLGAGDTIETFGGVDLTGAVIAAGTTIVAHSTVRLTEAQLNALGGITFVGAGAHGLQIVDSATEANANLGKVTVSNVGGTLAVNTTAGAGTTTGTVTIQTGGTAPTVNTGVTFGSGTGTPTTPTSGTAATTLTNITDTFDNANAGTLKDILGGVTYTAPTKDSNATLYTTQANLTATDTLTFGTGTDTLVFTGGVTAMAINGTINGATVTGLNKLQLADVTNSVTITSVVGNANLEVLGGAAAEEITFAGANQAMAIKTQGGNDRVIFGAFTAVGTTVETGEGNDSIEFTAAAIAATATTVNGGNGTDTLFITAADALIADANFANYTGIEVLKLTGASTIAAGLGINAFNAGIRTVETGAGATVLLNTYGGAAPLTINAAALADGTLLTLAPTSNGTVNVTNLAGDLTVAATTANVSVAVSSAATSAVVLTEALHTGSLTLTGGTAGQEATIAARDGSVTATSFIGTLNATFVDITGDAATLAVGSGNVTVAGGAAADTITVTGLDTNGQTFVSTATAKINITAGAGAQTITVAAAGADTVTGGTGNDTINLTGTGASDVIVFGGATGTAGTIARVSQLGVDTITNFSGAGADKLNFKQADFGVAAGAVSDNQIVNVLTDAVTVLGDSTQNIGAGAFSYSAAGFFVVGTNAAGANQDIYFYDGSQTVAGNRTVAQLVADGDAVKIATVGLIDAPLNGTEFAWVA